MQNITFNVGETRCSMYAVRGVDGYAFHTARHEYSRGRYMTGMPVSLSHEVGPRISDAIKETKLVDDVRTMAKGGDVMLNGA